MATGGCTIEDTNNNTSTAKILPFAVVSCSSQLYSHYELFLFFQCILDAVTSDEDFCGSELNTGVLGSRLAKLQILLLSSRNSVGIAAAITHHQHAVAMSRVQIAGISLSQP